MISQILVAKIRNDLDTWEGPMMPWMYLDSVGVVTVGWGTALEDEDTAASLPFVHSKTQVAATADEIKNTWRALRTGSKAQRAAAPTKKHLARSYEHMSDFRLTPDTASDLRDKHVLGDYQSLPAIYPEFDQFPEDAQVALFDMIYNLGPGRSANRHHRASGLRRYVYMNTAINKRDWAGAAGGCRRPDIPDDRNTMTAVLFLKCAKHGTTPTADGKQHDHAAAKKRHRVDGPSASSKIAGRPY
jgi:GH24 family phage-related lysozyme (muramidase)